MARKSAREIVTLRGQAHLELALREARIREAAGGGPLEQLRAVYADRARRWAAHQLVAKAPALVRQWAAAMTARFGSDTVRMWHGELGWIEALAVARYGEAEDYWPPAFAEGDLLRAAQWQMGSWVPEGVKFAAGASSMGRPKLTARPS